MVFSRQKKIKIALLTSSSSPLFNRLINKIIDNNKIEFIAYDKKKDLKAKKIWTQRTKNRIKKVKIKNKLIPKFLFINHNEKKLIDRVKKKKIDLLISFNTPRILKKNILKAPKIGVLNCHPGILPNYRGCNCVEWALYNNDKVGNTCHLMTENIDEGPIICSSTINIKNCKDYFDVRVKTYLDSVKLISKAIEIIKKNKPLKKFKKNGKYWKPISKEKLDFIIKNF